MSLQTPHLLGVKPATLPEKFLLACHTVCTNEVSCLANADATIQRTFSGDGLPISVKAIGGLNHTLRLDGAAFAPIAVQVFVNTDTCSDYAKWCTPQMAFKLAEDYNAKLLSDPKGTFKKFPMKAQFTIYAVKGGQYMRILGISEGYVTHSFECFH